jgi:cytochrome c oxidase subunit 2
MKDLWGKDERVSDGSTVKVDENYVRESILEPSKVLVEGYGTTGTLSKMPSFQGKLSDAEIGYLIDYIRWLKDSSKFPARDELPPAQVAGETPGEETAAGEAPKEEKEADNSAEAKNENQNENN